MEHRVFIGRFQLPHFGHFLKMSQALSKGHLHIIIGSASTIDDRNIFTFEERKEMIIAGLQEVYPGSLDKLTIDPLNDKLESDAEWLQDLEQIVNKYTDDPIIVGSHKDDTSYYLAMFEHWKNELSPIEKMYHSTELREMFYRRDYSEMFNQTPAAVVKLLARKTIH